MELKAFVRSAIISHRMTDGTTEPNIEALDEVVIQEITTYYEEAIDQADLPNEWLTASHFCLLYDFLVYQKITSEFEKNVPDPKVRRALRKKWNA